MSCRAHIKGGGLLINQYGEENSQLDIILNDTMFLTNIAEGGGGGGMFFLGLGQGTLPDVVFDHVRHYYNKALFGRNHASEPTRISLVRAGNEYNASQEQCEYAYLNDLTEDGINFVFEDMEDDEYHSEVETLNLRSNIGIAPAEQFTARLVDRFCSWVSSEAGLMRVEYVQPEEGSDSWGFMPPCSDITSLTVADQPIDQFKNGSLTFNKLKVIVQPGTCSGMRVATQGLSIGGSDVAEVASNNVWLYMYNCPSGTAFNNQSNTCDECPAGRYSQGINAESCDLCPQGRHNPWPGGSTCEVCGAGTQASSDRLVCEACGPGKAPLMLCYCVFFVSLLTTPHPGGCLIWCCWRCVVLHDGREVCAGCWQ